MVENEQRSLFKRFVEESNDGMGWADLDGNIRYMNRSLCLMVGEASMEDAVGKPVTQYYDDKTRKQLEEEIFPAIVATGRWTGDLIITAKDGTRIPATHNLFLLRDERGNPISFANVLTDLTPRKRIEDELRSHRNNLEQLVSKRTQDLSASNMELQQEIRERERVEHELRKLRNLLSNVVNSMPSVLIGVDHEGRVTQWNKQAESSFGVSQEEAMEQPLMETLPNPPFSMAQIEEAMKTQQVLAYNKIACTIKGDIRYNDVTIYPLISNGLEGAVIRVDDVTERVRMDETIVQSEKMLSVGGLAAGMAHEINNPLSGILQNAQVMRNRVLSDLEKNVIAADECGTSFDVIRDYMKQRNVDAMIDSILESGKRASAVVDNMLTFSRRSGASVSEHNLAELLDKAVELASSDYDLEKKYDFRKITIEREYDTKSLTTRCEGSKIQQVFLNLLKNSAQAMAHGNTEKPRIALRVYSASGMIHVEVEDNGPGMPQDVLRRVFEPFFTTKDVGVGTGLGLSVAYFIITENHGGTMSVESTPGRGTTFTVRLPQ